MAERLARHLERARADGADGDDEAPLPGLRDPHPLDVARRRHRRRRPHRRARVLAARPGPPRPARAAAAGRRRAVGVRGSRAARARCSDRVCGGGGVSAQRRSPGPVRRDGRAGRRPPLELPGLVRGRARRVPRAVRRRLPAAARPGDRVAPRRGARALHQRRRGSTTGCVVHSRCLDVRGRAVQVRVRGRARRDAARRGLHRARHGRRHDDAADADAAVARRRYCSARGPGVGGTSES